MRLHVIRWNALGWRVGWRVASRSFFNIWRRVYPSHSELSSRWDERVRTVFPALSRPRKRILAFLCNKPWRRMSEQLHATMLLNHTKRREHIPEPVEDEHDGRAKSSARSRRKRCCSCSSTSAWVVRWWRYFERKVWELYFAEWQRGLIPLVECSRRSSLYLALLLSTRCPRLLCFLQLEVTSVGYPRILKVNSRKCCANLNAPTQLTWSQYIGKYQLRWVVQYRRGCVDLSNKRNSAIFILYVANVAPLANSCFWRH